MMRAKFVLSVLTLLFISLTLNAQENQTQEVKASLNSGTLESQFDYMFKKSFRWTDPKTGLRYKTIKVNDLYKFRGNAFDSLKSSKAKYAEANATIATQRQEIEGLKADLGKTNEDLSSVTKEKDNISFLGISMSKAGYNTILWSIIAALSVLLAIFIGRFKRSNVITVQARNAKAEIEEEYEGHRQRSLEREQKLRRELQDEINKQKYAQQDAKKGTK
ncbi:MAG: tRNA (guanine-N1)-methyltransferase [Flavobacteriaceae bacterium]|nr:tRNA (guanine-N1)-methyltransferase [Flavobacteriaceae bacterium]